MPDFLNRLVTALSSELFICFSRKIIITIFTFSEVLLNYQSLSINYIFSFISIVYDSGSFQDVNCKYRMYLDEMDTITETVSDTSNPDFQHQKMFSFTPVTRQVKHCLNYFMNSTERIVYNCVPYRKKIVRVSICRGKTIL